MSYHIIDISTNNSALSVKDGKLVCRNSEFGAKQLPMEDIGAILINCFSANLHSSFLIEAAKKKIAVILCEKFRPVSMVLPVQRSSDTLLTRAQIQMPKRCLRSMWQATIDAKCANQYEFLSRIPNVDEQALADFRISMNADTVAKEGNCARIYWNLFSNALEIEGFRRLTQSDGLNSLLNYGYAVLLLRIEQKLLACGLDPLYGMGHMVRERSLPLAYDMMEPFRPVVDEQIYKWIKDSNGAEESFRVEKPFKTMIQGLMQLRFPFRKARAISLDKIVEQTMKSYREALLFGKPAKYEPWIRRNSKWDG
ncbi:MAG: type II CRISPR-associated endonuclease Cas1 [Kiritimatiellae bacterium]|nr:type II CRISPR-associated endonuclease Cas1 [Kiritimatiellia bacterium]